MLYYQVLHTSNSRTRCFSNSAFVVFHVETLQQPILHQNHQLVTEQQFSGLPEMLGSSCNLLLLIAADAFCELRRKRRNGLAKQSKEHAPKASEAFDSSMRSNLFADIQAKAGVTKHVKSACQVRQVRSVINSCVFEI